MPSQSRVAIDSSPRLHGIFDTINATLAASKSGLRLPDVFYDPEAWLIMSRVLMEEKYAGYHENTEYRRLGIGPILGQVVGNMVGKARRRRGGGINNDGKQVDRKRIEIDTEAALAMKLGLYSCHDSTLAAMLTSLAVGKEDGWDGHWPPYTSNLALELFSNNGGDQAGLDEVSDQSASARGDDSKIKSHYVRLRYNDVPVRIPGCRAPQHHLKGNDSFCTLVSPAIPCVLLSVQI